MIGVVTSIHNSESLSYQWYNGLAAVGKGDCLIDIEEPGIYFCRLKISGMDKAGVDTDVFSDTDAIQIVRVPNLQPATMSTEALDELPSATSSTQTEEISDHKYVISPSELTVLDERIDQGAFGEVFKGEYRGKIVAIKRIQAKFGKRPDRLILK